MKRMMYEIEIVGRVFGTREQIDGLTKAINQQLASIETRGGIAKVPVVVTPMRKAQTTKKKAATAPQQEELKPN